MKLTLARETIRSLRVRTNMRTGLVSPPASGGSDPASAGGTVSAPAGSATCGVCGRSVSPNNSDACVTLDCAHAPGARG